MADVRLRKQRGINELQNGKWPPRLKFTAFGERHGGKASYGEWCHVIGIFQTLMYQQLRNKTGNTILDAGCGTGILAIASEPFLGENGKYIGIDVQPEEIEICEWNIAWCIPR